MRERGIASAQEVAGIARINGNLLWTSATRTSKLSGPPRKLTAPTKAPRPELKCGLKRHRYSWHMNCNWAGMRWLLVILLAGCAWMITACAPKPAPPLVIGMELNYPPFEMTDASGTPTGVGVDMAHALCDYLHRPIDIQNMPFEGLIPALKTGRIDLIISSMTATDERRKSIDFSDPYLNTGLAILGKEEQLDPKHRRRRQARHHRGGEDRDNGRRLCAGPF